MARVKTDSGVLRDTVNDISESVRFLRSGVAERNPQVAIPVLAELREQVLGLMAQATKLDETFALGILPAEETETEEV